MAIERLKFALSLSDHVLEWIMRSLMLSLGLSKGTALVSICEELKCDLRVYISEKMELKGLPFGQ